MTQRSVICGRTESLGTLKGDEKQSWSGEYALAVLNFTCCPPRKPSTSAFPTFWYLRPMNRPRHDLSLALWQSGIRMSWSLQGRPPSMTQHSIALALPVSPWLCSFAEKGIHTSTLADMPSKEPEGPSTKAAWTTLTAVTKILAEKIVKSSFRKFRGRLTFQSSRSGMITSMQSDIQSATQWYFSRWQEIRSESLRLLTSSRTPTCKPRWHWGCGFLCHTVSRPQMIDFCIMRAVHMQPNSMAQ